MMMKNDDDEIVIYITIGVCFLITHENRYTLLTQNRGFGHTFSGQWSTSTGKSPMISNQIMLTMNTCSQKRFPLDVHMNENSNEIATHSKLAR